MEELELSECYAETYAEAREKFVRAVNFTNGKYDAIPVDLKLPLHYDEYLSIDLAYYGSPEPEILLVHSTGVRGVDGFHGSAIQIKLILDHVKCLKEDLISENIGLLFVHAVNPYGMAHSRITNESNVDLNNNFRTNYEITCPEIYEKLNHIINPTDEKKWWKGFVYFNLIRNSIKYSLDEITNAITKGQNKFLDGIFNFGFEMEQGPKKLIKWIKENVDHQKLKLIINIDVHIGTGTFGVDTVLLSQSDYNMHLELYENIPNKIIINDLQPDSVNCNLKIGIQNAFPDINVCGLIQEFGTYSKYNMLSAIIRENYYNYYQLEGQDTNHFSKVELKNMFYPNDVSWRKNVLQSGVDFYNQIFSKLIS